MKQTRKAQILIRNAFIRLSMVQIFRSTPKEPTREVFRVNKGSVTPYQLEGWISNADREEFDELTRQSSTEIPPLGDNFTTEEQKAIMRGIYLYGFENREQHDRWFSKRQIELYEKNGFALNIFEATDIRSSGNQILFLNANV